MLVLILSILFWNILADPCHEECDNAFVWYVYDVCWVQDQYGESVAPYSEECMTQCTDSNEAMNCLTNAGCFDDSNTWCDSWQCDCSYQCEKYTTCVNNMLSQENIECAFQETCYAACPEEDDDYSCVEENCAPELEECFLDPAGNCLAAIENFDANCQNGTYAGDMEQCVENADDELLAECCQGDNECIGLFGNLAGCFMDNDCHKNYLQRQPHHQSGLRRFQHFGLTEYRRKKESLKQKEVAKQKRMQIERERKFQNKRRASSSSSSHRAASQRQYSQRYDRSRH